jgi:hypothetical protein
VSFLLFECVIAVSVMLALAELASWWAVAGRTSPAEQRRFA